MQKDSQNQRIMTVEPYLTNKFALLFNERSTIRSNRSDLVDLIALNQSSLLYGPRSEKID